LFCTLIDLLCGVRFLLVHGVTWTHLVVCPPRHHTGCPPWSIQAMPTDPVMCSGPGRASQSRTATQTQRDASSCATLCVHHVACACITWPASATLQGHGQA